MPLPLSDHEISRYVATGEVEPHTYDRLFDYFCNNGEMPYGTAKARTGDPEQWIAQRLEQEFSV